MLHRVSFVTALALALGFLLSAPLWAADKPLEAVAIVEPTKGNTAQGTVRFIQEGKKLKVIADITGLKPNSKHGFHIHEGHECGEDGMKAGGHYNPEGHPHGGPDSAQKHAGDLGNLSADASGKAHLELTVDYLSVNGPKNPIVGRTIMVHSNPDDLTSQPTGNAGGRIGCGVIKLK